MPHAFDEVGFYEHVFVLRHLCHGSRDLCITRPEDKGEDWKDYRQWMKSLVSDHLINLAIKWRILQDSFQRANIQIDFDSLDMAAQQGLNIGNVKGDSNPLPIREACNKVIHTTETFLEWKDCTQTSRNQDDQEYWLGTLTMRGHKDGKPWEVFLNVDDFSIALSRMVDSIDDVSWQQLYDHD